MVVDNGTIAEVIHFGSAFLHGAMAAAPGLFAISSCDTIHVFKYLGCNFKSPALH